MIKLKNKINNYFLFSFFKSLKFYIVLNKTCKVFYNDLNVFNINYFKLLFINLDLDKKLIFLKRLKKNLIKKNFFFLKEKNPLNKNVIKITYSNRMKKNIKLKNLVFFLNVLYTLDFNIMGNNNLFFLDIVKTTQLNYNKINLIFSLFFLNYNFKLIFKKNNKFNYIKFLKFFINLNDNYNLNRSNFSFNFFSNKYLIKYLNFYDNELKPNFKNIHNLYNNYYPISDNNILLYNYFGNKFKFNYNLNYSLFTNKVVIKFLEGILNKKIYIKLINNYFYKINNVYFNSLINENKNYKPKFFKKFLVSDFIEILWYSFLLKDLKMISNWISNFMESLTFKSHKKFISFFNNFINKYSTLFIDVLGIKGFFFDIRGKVGVTGSSKKRHLCFKFGSLNKSSKKNKINFNQSLVRTYSGVMGLTYIINF